MRNGLSIAALVMVMMAVHNEASALVFCARRSGNLVLRPACKPKEKKIDLSMIDGLGAQGPVGPTGSRGLQGVQGPTGVAGVTGPTGPAGVPGTATAFAVVDTLTNPPASFVPEKTRNFVGVTSPLTGVFCLTPGPGIDPSVTPAVVAPEWGLSTPNFNSYFVYLNAYNGSTNCPVGDFEVETFYLPPGGSMVPDAQFTDVVGFVIIVP